MPLASNARCLVPPLVFNPQDEVAVISPNEAGFILRFLRRHDLGMPREPRLILSRKGLS
jgi:hypothetical protein